MIYDDDNGASLQPQDDASWPIGRAWAVALCLGAAAWMVVGGLVWLILGEVGA